MEALKNKYVKETAESFKKKIKTKQPRNFWVDKVTETKGELYLTQTMYLTRNQQIQHSQRKKISVGRKEHSVAQKYFLQVLGV